MPYLDPSLLEQYRQQRLLSMQRHPQHPYLQIWNYTAETQYSKAWDAVTTQCRGLILDTQRERVHANPFPKFYNWGDPMVGEIPLEEPIITEKLDGCFPAETLLQCWNGDSVKIGDVVRKKLKPILIGVDDNGKIVPCEVIDYFDNGRKANWLAITVDCPVSKKSGAGGNTNIIQVTSNHHLFLNGRYQPAIFSKEGDEVLTFNPSLPESILFCIESGLLGDGSICPTPRGHRYSEGHTLERKEYTQTVRQWFGNCVLAYRESISGYGSTICWAETKQYPELTELRKKWYPYGKKRVPEDIRWIKDFSVAKWYMDDGNLSHSEKQRDRATFSTHTFPKDDVGRLAAHLYDLYGVDCTVFYSKGWVIRVNAGRDDRIRVLWESISPHIVPCMRYKIPEKYRNVPYVEHLTDPQEFKQVAAKILRVSPIQPTKRYFPLGKKGFDIKTTTGNYFAKGILVHNSLGILYWIGDDPHIATRGSFTSEQALWATKWFRQYVAYQSLPRHITYLMEIVYPANRIVVAYPYEGCVLLAARETATGTDYATIPYQHLFPLRAKQIPATDLAALAAMDEPNSEGFVLHWPRHGQRVKIKFPTYCALHRVITGLSVRVIYEHLASGQPLSALLDVAPDEMYPWIQEKAEGLQREYDRIEDHARIVVKEAQRSDKYPTRKDQAALITSLAYPGVCFSLLDGKDPAPSIWKLVRPTGSETYRQEAADA